MEPGRRQRKVLQKNRKEDKQLILNSPRRMKRKSDWEGMKLTLTEANTFVAFLKLSGSRTVIVFFVNEIGYSSTELVDSISSQRSSDSRAARGLEPQPRGPQSFILLIMLRLYSRSSLRVLWILLVTALTLTTFLHLLPPLNSSSHQVLPKIDDCAYFTRLNSWTRLS